MARDLKKKRCIKNHQRTKYLRNNPRKKSLKFLPHVFIMKDIVSTEVTTQLDSVYSQKYFIFNQMRERPIKYSEIHTTSSKIVNIETNEV